MCLCMKWKNSAFNSCFEVFFLYLQPFLSIIHECLCHRCRSTRSKFFNSIPLLLQTYATKHYSVNIFRICIWSNRLLFGPLDDPLLASKIQSDWKTIGSPVYMVMRWIDRKETHELHIIISHVWFLKDEAGMWKKMRESVWQAARNLPF